MRITAILMLLAAWALTARAQERPDSAAMAALERRAEAGDPEAMNYLGYLLLSGETAHGESADGLIWLVRAASAGSLKAASNLGWLYMEGELVAQDYAEAARWLQIAADGGQPVARSLLGDLYLEGRGVERDSLMAADLYRKAFDTGLTDAGRKLFALEEPRYALMDAPELVEKGLYFYRRGVASEGVRLFYLAAEQGSTDALALLGDAYTRAMGVPYDYELSLKYYVEAAAGGNAPAQFVVAELLDIFPDTFKGRDEWAHLPDDPAYWYEAAAAAGITDAAEATNRLLGQKNLVQN